MLGSVTGAAAVLELLRSYELPDRITRSSIYARAVDMCAKRGLRAVFVSPFINISGPMLMAAACCKELDKRKVKCFEFQQGLEIALGRSWIPGLRTQGSMVDTDAATACPLTRTRFNQCPSHGC